VPTGKTDIASLSAALLAALLGLGLLVAALAGGTYALIPRSEWFVVISWSLTLGLSFGLFPRARLNRAMFLAVLCWIVLVAWVAVGLTWTESGERTVIELTRVTGFAGIVLAVGWSFVGPEWRLAAAALTAAAAGVCLVALISRLAPDLLASPLRSSGLVRRLSFPLNYWNALGCWAAMTVALTLPWSAHAGPWPVRGAALAGTCLATSVAYLTYSRSAVAGLVIAAAAVLALSPHRWLVAVHIAAAAVGTAAVILAIRSEPAIARGTGGEGGATVALVAVVAMAACVLVAWATARARLERLRISPSRTRVALTVCVVAVLLGAVTVGPALANRAWRSFEEPTPSLTGDPAQRFATLGGTRRALWGAALSAFRHDPLTGTGAGTFEFVWNRDPRRSYFVRDAHSLYIESLGELGLPGALFVVAALGTLLAGSVRTALAETDAAGRGAAAGCCAALLVFCVTAGVDWLWESTAVAAMALAAGSVAAGARAAPAPRRTIARRAPLAVGALLVVAIQLPVLGAATQIRASQHATERGDLEQAVVDATNAVHVAPWQASGYVQRALVLERLGLAARAAADARRAIQREPTNWEHWLILARIQAERGNVRGAVAAARRSAALNPQAPLFRSQE
jgi:O-antigen ligase